MALNGHLCRQRLCFLLLSTMVGAQAVELRLKNGGHHCEGRVEVKHQGIWGTVHGYKWTLENAAVLCRQLDCGDAVGAPRGAHFGSGVGPIWLAYLFCKGTESTLNDCRHSDFKNYRNYGYYHKWDAGVVCSGSDAARLCTTCAAAPGLSGSAGCTTPGALGSLVLLSLLGAHGPRALYAAPIAGGASVGVPPPGARSPVLLQFLKLLVRGPTHHC
ncbi:antigen WC1.1-like [Diceros bicornis minor]|uniref:antigen WC1.1-like n=1 Tax=Diceros bicornis minor TaxID=77932 RepID=UPI0026ED7407|nr:antigen WC1.1-like [Diceros bicornis minor]